MFPSRLSIPQVASFSKSPVQCDHYSYRRKKLGYASTESMDRLRVNVSQSSLPLMHSTQSAPTGLSDHLLPPNYKEATNTTLGSTSHENINPGRAVGGSQPTYQHLAGDMPLRAPDSPILGFSRKDFCVNRHQNGGGPAVENKEESRDIPTPASVSKYHDGHRYTKVPDLDVYEIETVLWDWCVVK